MQGMSEYEFFITAGTLTYEIRVLRKKIECITFD